MSYNITERAKSDMIGLYVDGAHKHGTERAERYYEGLTVRSSRPAAPALS